jgi:1-acyl-sn-glycerol-3-phosphate acyltransferase
MIIKSKHNPLVYPFFKIYTILKIRRNFTSVNISGEFEDKEMPVLLICNHISWWDGFWAMHLNMKVFKRKFHFMMLEDQLDKYWFFKLTGGYPVRRGSKSVIDSINYTNELLSEKNNIVLLFPGGKIESLYNNSIEFEKGVVRIINQTGGMVHIIFVVNLIEYFSESRPGLYIYYKEYDRYDEDTEVIQRDYNEFYSDCVSENIQKAPSR